MTMRECLEDHKKRVDKGKKNVDKKLYNAYMK